MYIFGFDIPLIELIFIVLILTFVVMLVILIFFFMFRWRQRYIVDLLDILILLKDSEIDRLLKVQTLSKEEKILLREIESLRRIGIKNLSSEQLRAKAAVVKSLYRKIERTPHFVILKKKSKERARVSRKS